MNHMLLQNSTVAEVALLLSDSGVRLDAAVWQL